MAGLYVHIPFCKQRCVYCDFYSTTDTALQASYVDMLIAEAHNRHGEIAQEFKTLYLGGGTPSWLDTALLVRLLDGLRVALPLGGVEEFTIEVNPDDVTTCYAEALAAVGVNRVSMGVQSMVDDELRFMRRRHDARRVIDALAVLRNHGIDNISVDLIYGIPGQTMRSWQHSLDQVIDMGVQHISAYNLSYEKGTPLWLMRQQGQLTEVDDDTCVAMYRLLVEQLKHAGYEHYEISNFALPGLYSRHNSSYWDGTPYLGLGAAAHSYDGEVRRCNIADLRGYMHHIIDQDVAYSEERLSPSEQYDETVMLALRTARGLDTSIIHHRFGQDIYDYLMLQARPHIAAGLLTAQAGWLRLTPEAVMVSDNIISDLFR
ncbi:MAG: radical SAM family heme chaperone HemW [Muribaculaceae bacterium]|nr:radical SAM family heme chaperone HemW [Muribaculaceae bacterium]